jgi:septum formation protein
VVNVPEIILASASPRRSELLRQLEVPFQVLPGNVDEVEHDHLSPQEVCQLNAHRKARAVAKKIPDALVVGADTLVFLETTILAKPASLDEAHNMLSRLQGRTHQVVTGVSLIHLRTHHERIFAVTTNVTFRPLTGAQIDDYLGKINPLDKAGGYAIQEYGDQIVAEISGSYTNVVGLPLERLAEELENWPEPG